MYDEDEFQEMRAYATEFMHKRYTTIINKWCKEAGVETPVGYYANHQGVLEIYTDRPGYLIGKGGELYNKFAAILSDEFHQDYSIKFVEVRGGFANT